MQPQIEQAGGGNDNTRPQNQNPDLNVINMAAESHSVTIDDRLANLENDRKFKDAQRGENYRTHIHRIVCVGLYIVGFIVIAMILIRSWHLLAPERIHWLSPQENQDIERIIFGSILFSVLGKYFKKFKIVDEP